MVQALAELPVRQREVVVLRFFADLSVEQTATALGCSTGTVKSYTSRALARLRNVLADDNETEEIPHAH
jgi:RNA polymerase sigma factor (sigma-70 family)